MSKESSLSPEARSIIGAMVSRRAVLAGAGGLGAAGLLAACGGCLLYTSDAADE